MLDLLDYLYASIRDKNGLLKKWRFYSAERFIVRTVANFLLPLYFKLSIKKGKYNLDSSDKKEVRVIVSLTSFPVRINKIWLVIECIMRQSIKPDIIVLWLSKDQFPNKSVLPGNLLKLEKRGLRIELRDSDFRSHKKYFYTLQEFPNDIMITIDDDIFYPSKMIEELIAVHGKFPNAVIARYGYKIKVENENISPYKFWEISFKKNEPDFEIFFGSGGGTLFPPESLPPEALNKDTFMNICLYADDIWLNTMIRLNNKKIFRLNENQSSFLPVINHKNVSLSSKNLYENLNDLQLLEVRKYFITNKGIDPYSNIL